MAATLFLSTYSFISEVPEVVCPHPLDPFCTNFAPNFATFCRTESPLNAEKMWIKGTSGVERKKTKFVEIIEDFWSFFDCLSHFISSCARNPGLEVFRCACA